jgi:putative ribose/galactose/methyl galactoside import ATP-binding protein
MWNRFHKKGVIMQSETCFLELKNISKSFAGVPALRNVSLQIRKGEVHALCGENGAGKSTLIKILSGVYQPDNGDILIQGQKIKNVTPQSANKMGIYAVYQENALVGTLSVAENIYLNKQFKQPGTNIVDWSRTYEEAGRLIEKLKINIDPYVRCNTLGIAGQQAVQIVKALAQEFEVLILDEPTASFGKAEIDNLFRIINLLRDEGKSIIYISHHIDEVFEIANKITVIRDGEVICTEAASDINKTKLINYMIGREATTIYEKSAYEIGALGFSVQCMSRSNVVKNVSFDVHYGEILGIYGMVGAGRTELARLIFGVDQRDSGRVFLHGKDVTPSSPKHAIKAGIAFLTEDRRQSGLVINKSIEDNIILPSLNLLRGLFLKVSSVREIALELMQKLGIKAPNSQSETKNLSGGNQQKVVVAKWLNTKADVFLFDEPTRGIDVGAKGEIYKLCNDLARQGKIIVFITSDMEELLCISDRVLIMREGKLVAELTNSEITQSRVLYESIGGVQID